jgi:excisionase family DNA binding protein
MAARRLRQIDLTSESGPPVTTGELARVTGLSVRTIQRDIALGELKAIRRSGGRRFRVVREEARRYAIQAGAIPDFKDEPDIYDRVVVPATAKAASLDGMFPSHKFRVKPMARKQLPYVERRRYGKPPLISYCQQPECPGRSACKACRNICARVTRTRHSEMTDEQRQRANARSYANVYQRRGDLKPQPCEACGSPDAEKHHDDYGKPLMVRWRCRACHLALHV